MKATEHYIRVAVQGDERLIGSIVLVAMEGLEDNLVLGRLTNIDEKSQSIQP